MFHASADIANFPKSLGHFSSKIYMFKKECPHDEEWITEGSYPNAHYPIIILSARPSLMRLSLGIHDGRCEINQFCVGLNLYREVRTKKFQSTLIF
jgi:hypothetical protein